jgi:hypothetical protein
MTKKKKKSFSTFLLPTLLLVQIFAVVCGTCPQFYRVPCYFTINYVVGCCRLELLREKEITQELTGEKESDDEIKESIEC